MEYFFKLFMLSIGIAGLWFIIGDWIKEYIGNKKRKKKVNLRIKKENDSIKTKVTTIDHPIVKRIKLIIELAHKDKITFGSYNFMLIMLTVFSIMFLYLTENLSMANVLFSFLLLLFPIGYTFSKFYFARLESSYEGERLIIEFINQYHLNNENILETINNTSKALKTEEYSKIALNRLYFNLNNVRNNEDREKAVSDFSYTINTQWAKLLGHNILSGLTLGVNISRSLDDILQEVKEIKNSIEKSKRDNNEGFNIIVFLVPGVYVVTTYYGMKSINISFAEYLDNQFTTSMGYKLAILILILYSFALVLRKFLKKPKFD